MSTPAFDADLLTDVDDIAHLVSPLATATKLIPNFRPRSHQKIISDAIVDAKEGRGPRFIGVSIGQQYGKSTVTSQAAPLWWLELHSLGLVPGGLVGLMSYEDSLAMTWSTKVRRAIEANPDQFFSTLRKDSKAASYWETEQGGGIIAVGSAGSIQGRPISLLGIDDPTKNFDQAMSLNHQDKLWDMWTSVIFGRLQPWTIVLVTMARWAPYDFIGRLKSRDYEGNPEDWCFIDLPVIADSKDDQLGREIGEPLIRPQADQTKEQALEELKRVKESISTYAWSSLWMQNPRDADGTIFSEAKWRYWGGELKKDEGRIELPTRFDQLINSWDMAFKDLKSSDWVVGGLWGRIDADWYLIDLVRGRWSFTETCSRVKTFSQTSRSLYPKMVIPVVVEEAANGVAVINQLQSQVGAVVPFDPRDYGSKLARANAVQPFQLGGNIIIPAPSERPWVRAYMQEMADFRGDDQGHDDQVDMTTQAILWMQEYRFEESGIAVPSGNISNLGPIPRADSPLPFRQYMR